MSLKDGIKLGWSLFEIEKGKMYRRVGGSEFAIIWISVHRIVGNSRTIPLRNEHLDILIVISHRILPTHCRRCFHVTPFFYKSSMRNYLRPSSPKIGRTKHFIKSTQFL